MQPLKAVFKKSKFTHTLTLDPKWNDLSAEDRAAWDALAPKIMTPALRQFDEIAVEITPEGACAICKGGSVDLVTVSGTKRTRLIPVSVACTSCLPSELTIAPLR